MNPLARYPHVSAAVLDVGGAAASAQEPAINVGLQLCSRTLFA